MEKIRIFEQIIGDDLKIAIFNYIGAAGNPVPLLNDAISKYVGDKEHYEFVDKSLTNPWFRVIIGGKLNESNFITFEQFFRNEKIKSLLNGE
jgi:hypothetical protein